MKLDMYEINKLNPPGLLELAGLVALINRLIALVAKCGEANAASLHLARMITQNTKRVRENRDFNTNLRIKTWVLQTAERRAWARRVIGESRITRWQQDYDALARREIPPSRERTDKATAQSKAPSHPDKPRKTYERKPFALPRLADHFIMPFDFSRDVGFKPHVLRTSPPYRGYKTPGRKPVIFWPSELTADYTPEPEPTLGSVSEDTEIATTSKSEHDPPTNLHPKPSDKSPDRADEQPEPKPP